MSNFCPRCEDYRETRTARLRDTIMLHGCRIRLPYCAQVCTVCGEEIGSDAEDQALIDRALKAREGDSDG